MKTKKWLPSTLLTATLVFAGVAITHGGQPRAKYPAIAEAREHIRQAVQKIEEAQSAHRGRLGGHAQKAKELLQQADEELRAAAEYANAHHE